MIIGLTGGIACGKSIVASVLAEVGLQVIDADVLARKLVRQGSPILDEIRSVFGERILLGDGSLNRKILAQIVFSSFKDRLKLEAILHPEIIEIIKDEIEKARTARVDLVVCAPLLIEANLTSLMDVIWVVRSDNKTAIKRLCNRDGLTEFEAIKRIESQMPIEEKIDYADFVIDNDGTISELQKATLATLEFTGLALINEFQLSEDVPLC